MTKKLIIALAVVVVCAVGLFYIIKTGEFSKSKYSLDGTIALCTINDISVYQYSPDIEKPLPQHYNISGRSIPCQFKNQIPSPGCRLLLSSLKGCHIIYRTDQNIRSLPGIFAGSAAQAIRTLENKVR